MGQGKPQKVELFDPVPCLPIYLDGQYEAENRFMSVT